MTADINVYRAAEIGSEQRSYQYLYRQLELQVDEEHKNDLLKLRD